MKPASLLEEIKSLSRELATADRHVVDQHPASGMALNSMNSVRGKYKGDRLLDEVTAEFRSTAGRCIKPQGSRTRKSRTSGKERTILSTIPSVGSRLLGKVC